MRESIKRDRARIQVGKISNFGLLEMTRQRLREGSIKWETNLSLESFALKIIKKTELLAFTNKIKSINAYVPEKIKIYIDNVLKKEIDYFQKKYNYNINFIADPELLVPEYKISLLNKSKKIVSKIENINKNDTIKKSSKEITNKKNTEKPIKVEKEKKIAKKKKVEPTKKTRALRTLWIRRKKKV